MNNLENVEEIILTEEQQVVILKIEALEEFLEIDSDDLEIVELDEDSDDDNNFKATYNDEDEYNYLIYTATEKHNLIKYELLPNEIYNAEQDLKYNMRNSNYMPSTFIVDEDELEEYCLNNYEDILDTEPREIYYYKGVDYIFLKRN